MIDLADVKAFSATAAGQVQPLLDTQGSVLMHELSEVVFDGGAANFPASHAAAILEENSELTSQGIKGMRLGTMDTFKILNAATGAFEADFNFQTTAAVAAAGGQPALAAGALYTEVILGKIAGANASVNSINRGLVDFGQGSDGTSFDVSIDLVTLRAVPEPASLAMMASGGLALLAASRRRRLTRTPTGDDPASPGIARTTSD